LPSLDDFGASQTLRKFQRLVIDERFTQNDDEQHAKHTADQHEQRAFKIIQILPHAGEDEGWDGENRAGRQSLAHRTRCSGHVFFQNGALEDAQHRHGDDRRWKRCCYGHARAQTQIGVGSAENDG